MTQQYPPQPPPWGQQPPGQPYGQQPQWQGYQPPPPAPKPKRSHGKLGALCLLVVGMFVACGIAGQSGKPATPTSPTWQTTAPSAAAVAAPAPQQAAAAAPAEQQQPSGPKTSFGDGQWSVPDEVAPGTYRSAGPASSAVPMCYADTTPAAGGNILEQEVSDGGPVRIRVKAGQVVKASGCQDFTKVG